MDAARAFEIVLELARGNLAPAYKDTGKLRAEQEIALKIIEDIAVNDYGDDGDEEALEEARAFEKGVLLNRQMRKGE